MDKIIQVEQLVKKFGKTTAVDRVDITVCRGEIYGFLGPNGAGKTTTMRMIMGMTKPHSGSIQLFGDRISFGSYRHLARIGSMIETPGFYPNLTAAENLEIHRRLFGVSDRRSISRVLDKMGLADTKKTVRHFSSGMKQRLGLARSLLHEPELLVLDEPMNGLDPQGIKEVRTMLSLLASEKHVTILISSHILDEVARLATRISIIHRGRKIHDLDSQTLGRMSRKYLELSVSDPGRACMVLEQKLGITDFQATGQSELRVYERLDQGELVSRTLVENGIGVHEMKLMTDSLEDFFLSATSDDASKGGAK